MSVVTALDIAFWVLLLMLWVQVFGVNFGRFSVFITPLLFTILGVLLIPALHTTN